MPKRNLAWVLIVVAVALILWQLPQTIADRDSVLKAFGPLVDARHEIERRFVTEPDGKRLSRAAIDVSGRPYLIWQVAFSAPKLGDMDTELFREWFQAFAQNAGITLHVENLYGDNNHHIVESCYKALARALRGAIEIDPRMSDAIPSTKGTLGGADG